MVKLEHIKENIRDAKEIAEKLNFPIILDGGSLLGAYRDKGVIKGDEDDVDFAVPYEVAEFKMLQIIKEFEERGFELFRLRPTVMTFKRNETKIDLLFYKWSEDWGCNYLTLYHDKKPFALIVPAGYWLDLSEIEFLGIKLKCPKEIERYLEWRFGDWRTPVLRPNFGFQSYLENDYNKELTQCL